MPITRASRASRANRTLLLNEIKFAFGSIVSNLRSENYFNENSRLICNKQFTT